MSPIVTRVPAPGALGRRSTDLVENSELERFSGTPFDHKRARITLCGNPDMVDLHKAFSDRGFAAAKRVRPGHLAVENHG